MKLAAVLLDNSAALVAKMGDEPLRKLDLTPDMLELLHVDRAEREAAYLRGQPVDEANLRFLAPIAQPGKIIAIGQNYMDHCREQHITPPDKPLIFAKLPSSITATGSIIQWDPELATKVDYEAELAVIIGKETRLVSPESAMNYVFGYTTANDVTARDLQKGDGQWTRAKGMDTFCPLGPWLVTADEIADPQNLAIRSTVNGEVRQDSSTREMVFDVKTLISYISRAFTLYPGDILLTGTPSGVGNFRNPPALLHDGDTVVVEIEGIGRLENLCRELTFRLR
jgi:2-keto-4-pentenoate hydratase/2-oxohepta-3-ene-1,7-dioic acid hydratase in catechol pathway